MFEVLFLCLRYGSVYTTKYRVGHTVKPVLSGHSKRRPKLVFNTNYHLMQVKSIEECSKRSILQYFRPALSYHLSLRSLFCLFLSSRLRQVLLYCFWLVWLSTRPPDKLSCQLGIYASELFSKAYLPK